MMSIPLILVAAARFHYEPVLDFVSYYAILWLINAAILLASALFIGARINKMENVAPIKIDYQEITILVLFSFLGAILSLLRRAVAPAFLWNILIFYWVLFTILICRAIRRFLRRCQNEGILS